MYAPTVWAKSPRRFFFIRSKRENPGEGDNYFVDVYRFVMDVQEEDLHLQEEETDGHMFATLEQIKAFAAEGKFLHYDSIQAAFQGL